MDANFEQESAAMLVDKVKKIALKDEKEKNKKAKLDFAKAIFDQEVAAMQAGKDNDGKNPISSAESRENFIVPDPVDPHLLIRPDHNVNKDKPVEQIQFSSHDLRLKLWQTIKGYGPFKKPIVGPFEVALPPWLNFYGLIWGEDGEIYKEICSFIPPFLTVGWYVREGRAVSLVVGFKVSDEEQAKNHWTWQALVTLWGDVLTWVEGANDGAGTTLLESLTISHSRRVASVRDLEFPGLAESHIDSEANLDAAEQ
ncbi:hypothetical protein NW768_004827 [Fusarium equiseti]|uniref:Uncharacterized protein n=1 Tax=Fusarium equiseti TaxID=61235 RepID=A0ABQ8RH89_FUSEQ|nr:hypothetical protein NW768_004827 [Fusarium equiseti]